MNRIAALPGLVAGRARGVRREILGGGGEEDGGVEGRGGGGGGGTGGGAGGRTIRSRGARIVGNYSTTLSKCPRTLHVLWQEYQFGIGGEKAARLYTAEERGRNKYNFSLRKPFWDLVERMIRNGLTGQAAIHRIYEVYPNAPVTQILRLIRIDKKRPRGGHPQLV